MIACPSCGAPFEPQRPTQTVCEECASRGEPERPRSPLQDQTVGGYFLEQELGTGRFANSWLAQAPGDGGGVVFKLLRSYAPDEGTVQRFRAEARRLSSAKAVDHPGIARLLDAGVHLGGTLFVIYESGGEGTLADELRNRGRILPPRALELCAQICEALSVLHAAGMTHFSLKPANVGLARDPEGQDQAVLLDAFTAHLLEHAALRETGMLPMASAAYLSPEVAAAEHADLRADLYAVGILLFQLISGRLPLMGNSADELIGAHRTQRPLHLRDVGRRVHPQLEALLQRLLAKRPDERFSTAAEVAAALHAMAPLAAEAAPEQTEDELEDPLPITIAQPLEPEVVPPPRLRPGAGPLDVAGDERSEKGPWRLRNLALAASGLALLALVAVLWSGAHGRARKSRALPTVAAAPAPPDRPIAAQAAASPPPEAAPAPPPAESAPRSPLPGRSPSEAAGHPRGSPERVRAGAAPSPAPSGKSPTKPSSPPSAIAQALLGKAQQQLVNHQPKPAMQSLSTLLARPDLSNLDRARATRLMAHAEAQDGDKQAAIEWYRKYARLTADPAERARVVKAIQLLSH